MTRPGRNDPADRPSGSAVVPPRGSTTSVSTFCRICEARCGIVATVDDGRVVRIGPDKDNPFTWQEFCAKGRSAAELVEHPRRLRGPMRRVADGYQEASWNDALDDIAARLGQIVHGHGPDGVAIYSGNPTGFNAGNLLYTGAFARGLGSRQVYSVGSVDQNNLHRVCLEMYGRWLIPLIPDVDECDYFLLVGMNPAESTFNWMYNVPNGWRRILKRQANGAVVVVLDPVTTASAQRADEHVAVWPGADWAFLLAVLALVLRRVGPPTSGPVLTGFDALREVVDAVDVARLARLARVPFEQLERVAEGFHSARTAMVVCHTGVSLGGAGTVAEWLSHVLNAVTGRLDTPGGRRFEAGYLDIASQSGTRPPRDSRVRKLPAIMGMRSLTELADEINTPGDGQIRALICNSGNPVVSGPAGGELDKAIAQLDLVVAIDLVARESHRHADWLLPAAHWLEREDLLTNFSSFEEVPFVQLGRAVVEPPSGVREEWWIWRELASRMGLHLFGKPAGEAPEPREVFRDSVDTAGVVSWEQIESHPHGLIFGKPTFGRLSEALATPDRAVNLAPEPFVAELRRLLSYGDVTVPEEYPLVMTGARRRSSMNSWLNDLPSAQRIAGTNTIEMHEVDAAAAGVLDGDSVLVESPTARVRARVEVTGRPRPGVVIAAHGWGSRVFDPHRGANPEAWGFNRNLLASDAVVDPLSAIPALGTAAVRVRAEPPPA